MLCSNYMLLRTDRQVMVKIGWFRLLNKEFKKCRNCHLSERNLPFFHTVSLMIRYLCPGLRLANGSI
jgi:hypothetical protein